MRTKSTTILASLVLLFAIACGGDDAPIETTGGVTVIVTESGNNEPIAAAIVTLSSISQSHSTGSDGKVEITDLNEKTYTITVKKEGYQADSKQVTIQAGKNQSLSFSLQQQIGKLKVTPTEIVFSKTDTEKVIEIANKNDAATLAWSISGLPNWLTVSKESGTIKDAPENITVKIDRSKMNDGDNNATLIIKATNGEGSEEVSVSATKYVPQLAADPTSINFGSAETSKSITLKNSTQVGTISYKLLKKPDWVTNISNSEGTLTKANTKNLIITVDRKGLSPASYDGIIQFSSNKNTVNIEVYMTILTPSAPEVGGTTASEITHNSIKVQSEITSIGSKTVTSYGFCWSKSPNPTIGDGYNPSASEGGSGGGDTGDYKGSINLGNTGTAKKFEHIITNLRANSLYYIRAYATNGVGTTYGNQEQVSTLMAPTLATLSSVTANNIEATTASFAATINNGNTTVTDYGFCYSSSNNTPTVNDTKISLGTINVSVPYSKDINNLQAETTYYMRAYAINSKGTAYSDEVVTFTTKTKPPVVTSGLLAYYTFNEENAKDYYDNYNGILQGSGNNPTFTTDTPENKGKAAVFSQGKFYLLSECPDKTAEAVSYSVWIKMPTKISYGYGNSTIYATANYSTYDVTEYRRLNVLDNKVYWSGGGSSYFDLDISSLLIDNKWHHLVITTTNSADYKLYIDGQFYKENNSIKVTASNCKNSLIGYGFRGAIDNLRIYKRGISPAEIKEIYNDEHNGENQVSWIPPRGV